MIGAGQLARMTQRAAIDLAVRLEVLAASETDPAVLAGAKYRLGSPHDEHAIKGLADDNDVVTLDHELVSNAALVEAHANGTAVFPHPDALRYAQDKLFCRDALREMDAPIPAFDPVSGIGDVEAFAGEHGWPVVLKARTMGYDGRGVVVVQNLEIAAEVLERGGEWVVEEHIDIETEIAVLIARRPSGDARAYPVIETIQFDGICHELVMPARIESEVSAQAIDLGLDLVRAIDAHGIVAIEMFITSDGLLINEFATRPHNSGHATIEGSVTSQFHNHLRAVLDWPLGDTRLLAPAVAMVNILGSDEPGLAMRSLPQALDIEGANVHLYGKAERVGRKIGHITALGETPELALSVARAAAARVGAAK